MELTRHQIKLAMMTLVNPSGAWMQETPFAHIEQAQQLAYQFQAYLKEHRGDLFKLTDYKVCGHISYEKVAETEAIIYAECVSCNKLHRRYKVKKNEIDPK